MGFVNIIFSMKAYHGRPCVNPSVLPPIVTRPMYCTI